MRPTSNDDELETQQYIDHLEAQLENAQAARDELPQLTAQIKDLKTLLAEWETQYEERVEEMAVEGQRVKTLQNELEYSKLREQELERSLDSAHQSIDAAEAGNVQLEKRLEIMSDLLAQSPTKLDLHIGPRHGRQRSLAHLPKLPTAAALMSPTRQSMSFPAAGAPPMSSPQRKSFGFPFPSSPPSPTQTHHHEPARRMRRFHGGSMGPKPLILPSTSHHDPAKASPTDSTDRNDSAHQSSAGDHPHSALEDAFQMSLPIQSPRNVSIRTSNPDTSSEKREFSNSSLQSAPGLPSPRAIISATPKRPNLMDELRDFQSPDFWSSSPPPTSTRVTSRHFSGHIIQQTPRTPSPVERRKTTPLKVLRQVSRSSSSSSASASGTILRRPERQLSRIDALGLFFRGLFREKRMGTTIAIEWWVVGTIIGVCALNAARMKRVLK